MIAGQAVKGTDKLADLLGRESGSVDGHVELQEVGSWQKWQWGSPREASVMQLGLFLASNF